MVRSLMALKADLTLSILDSMRQRGMSVDATVEITGIELERMRALVERREIEKFSVEELADLLEAVDASGPRFGYER
ncbi:hypothetical protein [Mesorhizobium sp. ES1-4]|uniref:hypothetical protein n=1 Tax=Mesorhizobium sp. ES1-4 TaxID=2876627 RepID=UPI001CC9329E|nr:hypothetical protein [Mesorhizobium sp. ES1-4]MBZ9798722.1 hypothetical protein [Mesorhizobium sp. ES1-4]